MIVVYYSSIAVFELIGVSSKGTAGCRWLNITKKKLKIFDGSRDRRRMNHNMEPVVAPVKAECVYYLCNSGTRVNSAQTSTPTAGLHPKPRPVLAVTPAL